MPNNTFEDSFFQEDVIKSGFKNEKKFSDLYENKISSWPKIIFIISLISLIGTSIWAYNLINNNKDINIQESKNNVTSYFDNKKMQNQKLQEIINSTPVNWSDTTIKNTAFSKLSIPVPANWKVDNFEGAGNLGYYKSDSARIFATSLTNTNDAIAFSIRDNININTKKISIYEKTGVVKVGNTYRIFDKNENMSFYVEAQRVYQEGEDFKKILNCENKNLEFPADFCKNSNKYIDKVIVIGDLFAGYIEANDISTLLPTCQKNDNTNKCAQSLPIFIISTSIDNSIADEIVKKAIF